MEYLVRTVDGQEWPAVHRDRLAAVLIPGADWRVVEGIGDLVIAADAGTVTLSGEPPGWQVLIEGTLTPQQTDGLIGTITQQVADEVGEPCEWLRIG